MNYFCGYFYTRIFFVFSPSRTNEFAGEIKDLNSNYLAVVSVFMESRKRYLAPAVIKKVSVELEADLLAASTIQPDSKVKTMGQEVVTMDFSQSSFNQEWEK